VSRVDQILSRDPAGAYVLMDFETRDSYRNVVERIARRCTSEEWEVAEYALYLASTVPEKSSPRQRHVGYFLIDDGLRELELGVACTRSLTQVLAKWLSRTAGPAYVLTVLASGLVLLGLTFRWLETVVSPWAALVISLLALPAILMLCSGTLNRILTRWLTPTRLPKLDFKDGIRDPWKTIVAVPAMLSSTGEIDALLANLEINFLGNPNRHLSYALLTDYADAAEPESARDQALLDYVTEGIDQLNKNYKRIGRSPFHLFHRRRLWNKSENCWMGWERKRGKLEEFNQFLQGKDGTSFIRTTGDPDQLSDIRLVICLDADTHLAAGSAKRMVGTFAHPLNRPEFDAGSGRLIGGYTIIQPRVEINPSSANSSLFSRVFTGDVTLDLYSHAVSDVYQDLLGDGIFVGKGIYDLAGFTRSLKGNIPENRVLSHDLLESLHGRAALASDIVLFEDYPPTLLAYTRRQHRWIRGDWQLLPWLGLRAPRFEGSRTKFRPTLVGRWKMFDNLSRSLISPCLLGLMFCGWALLGDLAWASTLAVAALPGLPILFETFATLRRGTWRWGTIATTLAGKAHIIGDEITRWLLTLTFLPYQALLATDAILRTLYRVLFTRRHLLEWTSSAQVARSFGSGLGLRNTVTRMSPVMIIALSVGTAVPLWSPAALPAALPLLLAWFLSPLIAWWVGQPAHRPAAKLSDNEVEKLRPLARRTWHFFEAFVGPENQWLPPDNVQQKPKLKVAQRTSPTNIGFALLSTLAAYDFGYLAIKDLAARLKNSLQTLDELPRYRGHFLNWISTSDLSPLEPRYVSTVDSGNLVACLMTLVQGLEELQAGPVPSPQLQSGIVDTTDVMRAQLDRIVTDAGSQELDGVRQVLEDIRLQAEQPDDPADWWRALKILETRECQRIEREALSVLNSAAVHWSAEDIAEFRSWISSLRLQVREARREIQEFRPWTPLLAEAPDLYRDRSAEAISLVVDELFKLLGAPLTLDEVDLIGERADSLITQLDRILEEQPAGADRIAASEWNVRFRQCLQQATASARQLRTELTDLAGQATSIIDRTDFAFLYDRSRHVFHIGYNVSTGELDTSYYDLLASEARLASYVALAKQQVPLRHWVHLGRPLSRVRGMRVLLSWSATAFEYLMPRLLMACPDYCLLELSIPGLRRATTGSEAQPGRSSRNHTLCECFGSAVRSR
jgi:cyclic beta-1,2-glucan synthetase